MRARVSSILVLQRQTIGISATEMSEYLVINLRVIEIVLAIYSNERAAVGEELVGDGREP